MDWQHLDALISKLEGLIEDRTRTLGVKGNYVEGAHALAGFVRHDWRPVWEAAKAIQAGFNEKTRYPSKSEQEAAWLRFNNLRNRASEAANVEREKMSDASNYFRDRIREIVHSAFYSPITDVIFFFDPTTVEEMKHKSQLLKRAGEMLRDRKQSMLREHKDECFALINQARDSQKAFWEKRGIAIEERRRQRDDKRAEIARKLEGNLERNLERLEKAQGALERVESVIADLVSKIEESQNDNWRMKALGWLAEHKERRNSIRESLQRAKDWIEQDRERLSDIRRRD